MYERLADVVAILHGLVVVYVAGGTLLIVLGLWRGWGFVRQFHFRYAHLLLVLAVNVFEWANLPCPLTCLEWHLREQAAPAQETGFIQHYMTEQIHVDVEPSLIARLTIPLLICVALLYVWKGPARDGEEPAVPPPAAAPSSWRLALTIVWVAVLTLGGVCLVNQLARTYIRFSTVQEAQWRANLVACVLTFALCLPTPRRCGLGLGSLQRWRRWDRAIACVLAVPPLFVAAVYAPMTDRPFHGIAPAIWFLSSAQQEFLFAGFVYARLGELMGEPSERWRDAVSWPILITSVLFAAHHWANWHALTPQYFAFQMLYTFLGMMLTLTLRRWTDSLWPGVVLHILVNYLAANV